jgi:hypothetical protein
VRVPVFDLDGTLLDSDAALVQAFVVLGVPPEAVTFGHVVAEECRRLGIDLAAYLDAYDTSLAQPFPGVVDLVASLDTWAVCSNKVGAKAAAELDRLGWRPDVALFTEAFGGPKRLQPVLAQDRVELLLDPDAGVDDHALLALARGDHPAVGVERSRREPADQHDRPSQREIVTFSRPGRRPTLPAGLPVTRPGFSRLPGALREPACADTEE